MEWTLIQDGDDVTIVGPGGLELVIAHFDPALVKQGDAQCVRDGVRMRREWSYPLSGVFLDIVSRFVDGVGSYRMFFGEAVRWDIPVTLYDALCALGRPEE